MRDRNGVAMIEYDPERVFSCEHLIGDPSQPRVIWPMQYTDTILCKLCDRQHIETGVVEVTMTLRKLISVK